MTEHAEEQPLTAHLLELRRRLLYIVAGIVIGILVLLPWAQELYALIAKPLLSVLPPQTSMIATDVASPLFVPLKVAFMGGLVLSLPNTLYHIWAFVAPALYRNEKRLIVPLLASSLLLFAAGVAFCYFLVFPAAFRFLAAMTPEGVNMATDIGNYLSFVLGMFLAFGAAFEVPVAVVLLYRGGAVSLETLKAARPYVVVGVFVVAAVVTPPDVLSQVMLALPMLALYEIGLLVCRSMRRD
ncbi:twin-arginine translocase subunit TatC [Conchiformibius steedae DSM 2580]|uniref:Sec-independent protein translocase protein TatC n=1 Tax=Conchiformibius steedae DSM 2580 TaxID=1121352 RepID=A0AAE9HX65_9NEIS|nr:twin-arginine translocase subunit TatC [Conchiformibius steedae]QMT33634.1 twin-arginine translocase subunit TatC [Conchiformibius steedae]URD68291.1 twin-arginine translocase subunit TatC [Conchiformibius steedae DSM 2580]